MIGFASPAQPALELEDTNRRIGPFTADHHLSRCALIAGMFSIEVAPSGTLSAQSRKPTVV